MSNNSYFLLLAACTAVRACQVDVSDFVRTFPEWEQALIFRAWSGLTAARFDTLFRETISVTIPSHLKPYETEPFPADDRSKVAWLHGRMIERLAWAVCSRNERSRTGARINFYDARNLSTLLKSAGAEMFVFEKCFAHKVLAQAGGHGSLYARVFKRNMCMHSHAGDLAHVFSLLGNFSDHTQDFVSQLNTRMNDFETLSDPQDTAAYIERVIAQENVGLTQEFLALRYKKEPDSSDDDDNASE